MGVNEKKWNDLQNKSDTKDGGLTLNGRAKPDSLPNINAAH